MSRYSAIDRPAHGVAATLAVLFLVALAPLHAQTTYVVDSTGDGSDAGTGDGVCADAGGACTLRAAIEQANATAGLDDIHFDIAGDGPHTIALASTLPDVTDPVVIDGYTQAGSSPNTGSFHEGTNAVLTIVLEAPPGGDVLSIEAGGSTLRGLRIEGVTDLGIVAYPGGGNTIEGNVILAETSGWVVWIDGSDNTVGGTTPAARNVIGGGYTGVYITGGSGNVVQGNLIGTDAAGTGANGSGFAGVVVVSPGNTIGGDVPGAGNVISANGTGIRVSSRLDGETVIQGNLVGTDVTGTADLGNVEDGMFLEGTPMRIGGTAAAARNVVSGNGDNGIEGNYIGVDITGAVAIPNEDQGLVLTNGGHVVGGTAAGAGNVISGNGRGGITVAAGSSTIQGNRIGTDAMGTEPIPNVLGILINNASSNVIGGTEDGAANVIAANRGWGVAIMGSSSDNVVRGNFIGTDASASLELGNGVPAEGGDASSGVYIGGDGGNRVEGNVVAFSGYYGVDISSGTGNAVSGNRIFSNAQLGISLPPPPA